ncbi:MAG: hypothetical protein R3F41_07915 [Gammaproteobacteria bacterium]|nr:hypothetical protein [Pseudomonadales bacterium]MCP5349286.1 hypothetical protein [Pseudomonadales bacterium]
MRPHYLNGLLLLSLSSITAAQDNSAPRTEYNFPDFQGVWNFDDSTPFQRPARFGNRLFLTDEEITARNRDLQTSAERRDQSETAISTVVLEEETNDPGAYNYFWSDYQSAVANPRTSLIVYPPDGRIPPTRTDSITQRSPPYIDGCNDGGAIVAERPVRISWGAVSCDRPEDFGLATRCLMFPQSGGPHIKANAYNNNIRIVQTQDHVVIKAELGNDPRIIPLDGRPRPDERLRTWTGSSRGHWEGDTLVVVTTHFTGKLASLFLRTESYGSAEQMVLTERFTRIGEDAMEYEFTIEDPATFSDHMTVVTHMSRQVEPQYEFACHEGNYALTNMLRAARISDVNGDP